MQRGAKATEEPGNRAIRTYVATEGGSSLFVLNVPVQPTPVYVLYGVESSFDLSILDQLQKQQGALQRFHLPTHPIVSLEEPPILKEMPKPGLKMLKRWSPT